MKKKSTPKSDPTQKVGEDLSLPWRVNTPGLLREILLNPQCSLLSKPVNIFGKLLAAVGERATQMNDPELDALMCRLAIYSVADPNSPDYDREKVKEILALKSPLAQIKTVEVKGVSGKVKKIEKCGGYVI